MQHVFILCVYLDIWTDNQPMISFSLHLQMPTKLSRNRQAPVFSESSEVTNFIVVIDSPHVGQCVVKSCFDLANLSANVFAFAIDVPPILSKKC